MKVTIEISPEELLTLTGGDIIKEATEKAVEEFRENCMIDPVTGFNRWFRATHFKEDKND